MCLYCGYEFKQRARISICMVSVVNNDLDRAQARARERKENKLTVSGLSLLGLDLGEVGIVELARVYAVDRDLRFHASSRIAQSTAIADDRFRIVKLV